jgi:hypothetical protein
VQPLPQPEPRACTLCSEPMLEQPVVEGLCVACAAPLASCSRCAKTLGGKFSASDFGTTIVRNALASRHGCPGPCGRLGHVFRAGAELGARCSCGAFVRNDSERGMARA